MKKSRVENNTMNKSFLLLASVCLFILCLPVRGYCQVISFEVDIRDGSIDDFTYKTLELLDVADSQGMKFIRDLDPPAFKNDEVRWFNELRLWLREKCPHGAEAFRHPLYPPQLIENMRDNNKFSATCGPFSVAYAGLLLAYDIPVRLVHVYRKSVDGTLNSHTFNEVWSEQYQKWTVQDVDHNIFWIGKNNIPANTPEVQDESERCKNDTDCYTVKPLRNYNDHVLGAKLNPDLFYRIVISFRANYFEGYKVPYLQYQAGTMVHIKNQNASVFGTTGEIEENDAVWLSYKQRLGIQTVTDSSSVYAPVNQIEAEVFENESDFILNFKNNILNFDYYEVKNNDDAWFALNRGQTHISIPKTFKNCVTVAFRGVSKQKHKTREWKVFIKKIKS